MSSYFYTDPLLTEPTGNVAPRIAGERYEGGKLIDVPKTGMAALDCATQGFPVPLTRYYTLAKIAEIFSFLFFFTVLFQRVRIKSRHDRQARNSDSKLSWL